MVRRWKGSRGVSQAPAPVVEYISLAPAAVSSLEPVVEFLAPASVVILSATPVKEYIALAPTVFRAPVPVVEYLAIAPAVFHASSPVVEYIAPAPAVILAPFEEYISPVPVVDAVPAPVMEFIAPSAHSQFFSLSLSHQRRQTQFPIVNGTKSRKGIETPIGSSRFRPVDKAGHMLDVQVERVMRACVARLGFEWRRTKRRDKQLAGTLLHLSHEVAVVPKSWACGDVAGSSGGGPWSDSCSFCDRWLVSRVGSLERSVEFHEQAILALDRHVSVVDSLVTHVKNLEQLLAHLQHLAYEFKDKSLTVAELGTKLGAGPPGLLFLCGGETAVDG